MALDEGWLFIPYVDGVGGGSEMQVPVEKITVDVKDKGFFADYASDGHYGFSTLTVQRTVKVRKLKFANKTDYDSFLSTLDTLQAAGAFDIREKVASSASWRKWNGTNLTMPCLYINKKGEGKVVGGDQQRWEIGMLILRQAGALKDT